MSNMPAETTKVIYIIVSHITGSMISLSNELEASCSEGAIRYSSGYGIFRDDSSWNDNVFADVVID